jgi:alanyl-tRNA synthetase
LGDHVQQRGSNITSQRLRFDFSHPRALSDQEISKVEKLVNSIISKNLPVYKNIRDKNQALKSGALAFFRETYHPKVTVYTIGRDPEKDWFSKEICSGPHVKTTGEIGGIKIVKQQSIGYGVRRLYAKIDKSDSKD